MAGNEEIADENKVPGRTTQPLVMPEEFDLVIVNMDKVLYEAKAKSLIAPGPLGDFAVLPGHTPLFTILKEGKLLIEGEKGSDEIEIKNGIVKITQYKVIILVGF